MVCSSSKPRPDNFRCEETLKEFVAHRVVAPELLSKEVGTHVEPSCKLTAEGGSCSSRAPFRWPWPVRIQLTFTKTISVSYQRGATFSSWISPVRCYRPLETSCKRLRKVGAELTLMDGVRASPSTAVAGGGGIAPKSERCHRSGERRSKWSVSGEIDAGSARSGVREKGGHDFVMTWDDLKKIGHHLFSYELSLQVERCHRSEIWKTNRENTT